MFCQGEKFTNREARSRCQIIMKRLWETFDDETKWAIKEFNRMSLNVLHSPMEGDDHE